MLQIDGLGGGDSYQGLPASLYFAGPLNGVPAWDGNDTWPLYCEWMNQCQPGGTPQISEGNSPNRVFSNSYVIDRYWVSNGGVEFGFNLFFLEGIWPIPVHDARMGLFLGGPGAAGTISGIADAEETIEAFRLMAGHISTSLCSGPTFESVAQQIRAASDIMADGSQDPNMICNAISVGLAFDVQPAHLGGVLNAQPPVEDPCEP